MGIDIRDGQQLECITCALCIDACNGVMEKLGRPANLIGYDTLANDQRRAAGPAGALPSLAAAHDPLRRSVVCCSASCMVYALATRAISTSACCMTAARCSSALTEGGLRNGYTIRCLNKQHAERRLTLSVEGLNGAELSDRRAGRQRDRRSGGRSAKHQGLCAPACRRGQDSLDDFQFRDRRYRTGWILGQL